MKWTGNIIEPDGCLRKENRKREEKLKAERMAEAKKMADEIVQAVLKDMKDSKNKQAVPQGHLMCACAEPMYERKWMFEKMKMIAPRTVGLPQKRRRWRSSLNR
jgi:hypothetical protein